MQASTNQLSLARELGLTADTTTLVESLVADIEQALGEQRLRELCRWFVMSAYRYQQRGQWAGLDESGLDREQQYQLADAYLASRDGKTAVQAVLRDPRFRFTLVQFGKNRNPDSLTLSSSTKAFRRALQLLGQGLEQPRKELPAQAAPPTAASQGLVVDRRARRRGFSMADHGEALPPLESIRVAAKPGPDSSMNEDEYQALEQELEHAVAVEDRNFSYRSNEDKISLVLGMASGLVLFLLVLLVF